MHDGYLFTLGVSGTPQGHRPATQLLLTMMAALPPVKRVAALGDEPALHAAIAADLRDAELLLLATPALADGLPRRVAQLLDALAFEAQQNVLRGKVAALVAVGAGRHAHVALNALQQFCYAAGIEVAAAQQFPLILDRQAYLDAAATARQAYRVAEKRLPVPSLARLDG